jgi:DNA-binding transcriptional MerR regulator
MKPRIVYRSGGRTLGDVAELWDVPVGRVRAWVARGLLTPTARTAR